MGRRISSSFALLLMTAAGHGEQVTVRNPQGYFHGFVVLKDVDEKILASGDVTQVPGGGRYTKVMTLHFKDGSLYQETVVFSERKTYQILSYKQVRKGPSFPTAQTLALDTSTGRVNVQYTDKDGKVKGIDDQVSLPPDLANGMVPTLLQDVDPKVETTVSMLVATPKPRVVQLKISTSEQSTYSVGGVAAKANHYVIKVDLGGVTGVVAKAVGKQPPPIHVWVAAGNAPAFLKSEGPLFEDGPTWRIELASPSWPK